MDLSYDPIENTRNIVERGINFDLALALDWSTALVVEDLRKPYLDQRFQVLGRIGERLHMLVFTIRPGVLHVISLRCASAREKARRDAVPWSNLKGHLDKDFSQTRTERR